MRLITAGVAALVLAPAATAGFSWPGVWGAWVSETVDARSTAWGSLALDSDGNPRIAYRFTIGGSYKLAVATRDILGWQTETVPIPATVVPYLPSLAIDSQGRTHVAYRDGTGEDLRFVRWNGVEWVDEVAMADGRVGLNPRLVLTADDRPHIIHKSAHSLLADVYYTTKTEIGWSSQLIRSVASTTWAGITADADGGLHAVIQGTDDPFRVIYAHLPPSGDWTFHEFDDSSDGSIAVTPTGQPHIAYVPTLPTGASSMRVWHATLVNGAWQHTATENVVPALGRTAIAVDSQGRPHVTYTQRHGFDATQPLTGKIWYTAPTPTGEWSHEAIDLDGRHGFSWIRVGPDDVPRVSYDVITGSDVRYSEPGPARVTALALR